MLTLSVLITNRIIGNMQIARCTRWWLQNIIYSTSQFWSTCTGTPIQNQGADALNVRKILFVCRSIDVWSSLPKNRIGNMQITRCTRWWLQNIIIYSTSQFWSTYTGTPKQNQEGADVRTILFVCRSIDVWSSLPKNKINNRKHADYEMHKLMTAKYNIMINDQQIFIISHGETY
jgi:hypothetical protein